MPYPFISRLFEFQQPDGEIVKLKGTGNQFYAVFETQDGYTALQNEKGTWEYAKQCEHNPEELVASGIRVGAVTPASLGIPTHLRMSGEASHCNAKKQLRAHEPEWMKRIRSKKKQLKLGAAVPAPPHAPTTGNVMGLCLLIDFPDVRGTISRNEVEEFCNKPGYTGYGNNGSVRDYFYDNSNGKLTFTNTVTTWYTAKHPRHYYTNESISFGIRAQALVKEALAALKHSGFNFSSLTRDSKDNVKAVSIFYAGPCVNSWGQGLWPHSSSLDVPFKANGGVRLKDYQMTNMGSELSISTFCHENGHMVCDFPDLYDYGYESRGIGVFCLMCDNTQDEKNPPNVCAYLRYKAGWIDPETLTSGTHTVGPGVYIYRNPNTTEYFMLEVRTKKGRDAILPGSGLLVWHIDEKGDQNYEQGTREKHYECALMQADGKKDLEHGSNSGQQVDMYHTGETFTSRSNPNSLWWDGSRSGLEIIKIEQTADSSFQVTVQ